MKVEHTVKVEPVGEFELKGSGGLWRLTMLSPPYNKPGHRKSTDALRAVIFPHNVAQGVDGLIAVL